MPVAASVLNAVTCSRRTPPTARRPHATAGAKATAARRTLPFKQPPSTIEQSPLTVEQRTLTPKQSPPTVQQSPLTAKQPAFTFKQSGITAKQSPRTSKQCPQTLEKSTVAAAQSPRAARPWPETADFLTNPNGRISISCNWIPVSLTPGFSRVLGCGNEPKRFQPFPAPPQGAPAKPLKRLWPPWLARHRAEARC